MFWFKTQNQIYMKTTAYTLILLPLILIGVRFFTNIRTDDFLRTEQQYIVKYDFYISGENTQYDIDTFLPINTIRQEIEVLPDLNSDHEGFILFEGENKKVNWSGTVSNFDSLRHTFKFTGKRISYNLLDEYNPDSSANIRPEYYRYIEATELIQSEHPKIQILSDALVQQTPGTIETIQTIYDYVYAIPPSSSSELTSALTALENFEGSCNGKSRLMTALLRAQNIPTRMVGGIILEPSRKKTSHAWVEVYLGGMWVPFDALNGYFAELPSNYMEIYKGDAFLITRNSDIGFDYFYDISSQRTNHYPNYAIIDLWGLIDSNQIPAKPLQLLLLLPIGALIVAICENVVGMKTYGVFLPALIAFALAEMGLLTGIIFFSMVIILISLINYPLERWGLLQTPKVVVMLTAVVIYCLATMSFFIHTGWTTPASALLFPIIILTITAERFARKIEEESVGEALNIYIQTLLVTLGCYLVLTSPFIQNFIISFPELLITLGGYSILLGKWIGLRLTEYGRFNDLKDEVQYV